MRNVLSCSCNLIFCKSCLAFNWFSSQDYPSLIPYSEYIQMWHTISLREAVVVYFEILRCP